MKKKVVLSVNLALLFAFFIGMFGVEGEASAVVPRSGTSGTCSWNMDENGKLVIKPTSGTECTLDSTGDTNEGAPWYAYRHSVTSVALEKTVKTGESARGLFFAMINATSIDLTGLDTSNATNMQAMFRSCRSVAELDLRGFNTSRVTDMRDMFYDVEKVASLDLSSFDTSKVTDMRGMFYKMSMLSSVNLSSFNTSKVEDFSLLFRYCNQIKNLDLSGFSTASADNMVGMFGNGEVRLSTVKISDNLRLQPKEHYGASLGRGMYQDLKTGDTYSAVELSEGGKAGSYKKISDVTNELGGNMVVEYRVDKPSKIDELIASDGNFKMVNNDKIVYATIPLADGEYNLPGEITTVYKDVVTDIEGNKYDLKMNISNIKFYDLKADGTHNEVAVLLTGVTARGIEFLGRYYDSIDTYLDNSENRLIVNNDHDSRSYDVNLSVIKKDGTPVEGNYIFSIIDLDGSSYRDGQSGHPDLLFPERGFGNYSEGVKLINGFDLDTLMVSKHSDLLIMDGGKRITGKSLDNNSERSEFTIKANAGSTSFIWTTGNCMESAIFGYYQPEVIEIINLDEKDKSPLSGAKLELYRDGKLVEQWDSEKTARKMWVMPGMYTLKAVSAPNGYEVVTNEIVFFVDSDNGIMIDGEVVKRVEALDRASEKKPDDKKEEVVPPVDVEVPDTGLYTGSEKGLAISGSVMAAVATMAVVGFTVKKAKRNKVDFK